MYQQCRWTALPQTYSGMMLDSVSMVSATEGWAVGGDPSSSGQPIALRHTGGTWQRVTVSMPAGFAAVCTAVRMLNADEGWILAIPGKTGHSQFGASLLHYHNGAWTPVAAPLADIISIAPVGANDL
jgi:hypothetical protein